jgi:hypothetical protein
MNHGFQFLKLSLCGLFLAFCGCGESGNIGRVEGVVTIDGNPIDQAAVQFYPAAGRASVGYTDENGYYTLGYTRTVKGAEIGDHKVTIVTELTRDIVGEDGQPRRVVPGDLRKEMLAPRYGDRKKSDLTATVAAGSNVIDFNLETE